MGSLVVDIGDVFETLLAGSVPDLHFDFEPFYQESFDFEIDSNGGDVGVFVGVFAETGDEIGFAYSAISDDDSFS